MTGDKFARRQQAVDELSKLLDEVMTAHVERMGNFDWRAEFKSGGVEQVRNGLISMAEQIEKYTSAIFRKFETYGDIFPEWKNLILRFETDIYSNYKTMTYRTLHGFKVQNSGYPVDAQIKILAEEQVLSLWRDEGLKFSKWLQAAKQTIENKRREYEEILPVP